MKSLRVWLLVLLAVVLPFRDAMAAALPCAAGAAHSHGAHPMPLHLDAASATGAAPAQGHAMDDATAHRHAIDEAGASHAHDHGASGDVDGAGTCSLCASCCWAAAVVPLALTLPQALPVAAAFPEVLAPDAEFLSAGQDRPPRSI